MHVDLWESCINKIYRDSPASISIVKGEWKQGKTDFAIHIAGEELKRMGIVKRVAANIRCFEDKECKIPSNKDIEYIDNFEMLKIFIKQPGRKAFIYDEALKNTPSKRAMTSLNAEWLKIVPELSKGGDRNNPGGCHLFVLTQEDSLTEKLFMNPTFKFAKWEKITLSPRNPQFRKMVRLSSKLLKRKITFRNLPPTAINFNPYLSASWSMHPMELDLADLPLEFKVARAYANGDSSDKIVKDFSELIDRKDVTRKLRKALIVLLDKWQVAEGMRRDDAAPSPPQ